MRRGLLVRAQRCLGRTLKHIFCVLSVQHDRVRLGLLPAPTPSSTRDAERGACRLAELSAAHDILTPDLELKPFSSYYMSGWCSPTHVVKISIMAWAAPYRTHT